MLARHILLSKDLPLWQDRQKLIRNTYNTEIKSVYKEKGTRAIDIPRAVMAYHHGGRWAFLLTIL